MEQQQARDATRDEPAEVTADRDARHRERVEQVHDDQGPDAGGHRVAAPGPQSEEGRGHQPEHRPRRARGEREGVQEECSDRAAEDAGHVQQDEPARAEKGLQHTTEQVQGEHVEREVGETEVGEATGEDAPPLAVEVDRRCVQPEVGLHGARRGERAGRHRGDDEHGEVGADQHHRGDRAIRTERPTDPPLLRSGRRGVPDALHAVAPDRRLTQTGRTRRLAASAAVPAGLPVGVAVTGLDGRLLGHGALSSVPPPGHRGGVPNGASQPASGRALLLLAVVAFALVAASCASSSASEAGPLGLQGVELVEPTDRPDFRLVDTEGEPFDFAARTGGELTLMYFGYTECPDICPVHLAQLAEVLERPAMPDATVVFVSVDPARDTPEVIRSFLDRFDDRFIGLTGTIPDLVTAQEAVGVVPAQIDGSGNPEDGYLVGHAGQLFAYAPDDRGYVVYPFGTRQTQLVHDLPLLAEMEPTA